MLFSSSRLPFLFFSRSRLQRCTDIALTAVVFLSLPLSSVGRVPERILVLFSFPYRCRGLYILDPQLRAGDILARLFPSPPSFLYCAFALVYNGVTYCHINLRIALFPLRCSCDFLLLACLFLLPPPPGGLSAATLIFVS